MAASNPNQQSLTEGEIVVKELLSGGFAGSIGVFVGLPFDIVKVRMQVMASKYSSGIQCFLKSVREDGFLSLYRGGVSPVIANVLINAVLFATDGLVMRILEPDTKNKSKQNPRNHVIAGTIGGFVQCGVLVPFETVKCVMQVDGVMDSGGNAAKRKYTGTFDCAQKIFRSEGLRGLYKGFNATVVREMPSFGIYFTSYKWASSYLEKNEVGKYTSTALGGSFAGICSWGVVYPADVIKTYVQTASSNGPVLSSWQVTKKLFKKQGWQVFFRGLGPALARAIPVNAVTFLCYEEFKTMSGL
jgi:hypothetical protein